DPIIDTATVGSAVTDPDPSNNASTAQTPVNTQADVAVTKTVTPATATVGDTVTYTITAANLGPNQATGVVLTDVLPAGLASTGSAATQGVYDRGRGEWTVGALLNGASAQLTLTAQVTLPAEITNLAVKTAENEFDPNTSNDSAAATLRPP